LDRHIISASSEYVEEKNPINNLYDVMTADLIDIDKTFTCFSPWIQKHTPKLSQKLIEKQPVVIVPDFLITRKLVLLGLGIAVMPRYLIQQDLKKGKLMQITTKAINITR
jgi:DNA-binding transcriptional LysR family regulator